MERAAAFVLHGPNPGSGKHDAVSAVALIGSLMTNVNSDRTDKKLGLGLDLLKHLNEARSSRDCIRGILGMVKEFTGIEAVGIRIEDGDDYPYFEASGFEAGFIEAENRLCRYGKDGVPVKDVSGASVLDCMCGNVLLGKVDASLPFFTKAGSFWTNSTTERLESTSSEERQGNTRNRCHGAGYESVALIPLRSMEKTVGLLQLNDRRPGLFDEDLIRYFEEIGRSVGIALARFQAEEKLRIQTRRLEGKNRELQHLAYVASHDLQEPVRKIRGFTELLAERYLGEVEPKVEKYLGYITDGAERLQSMIQDLLDFSRITTRGKAFKIVSLETVVEQALDNLELFIQERGAEVRFGTLPSLPMDSGQMVRVFQNLIHNAVKFNESDAPRVDISATRIDSNEPDFSLDRRDGWIITVTDNGIGMAKKHHERIFDMFQRLHTREEYDGSGFGLAICKRIVERHRGVIAVESEEGRGAAFRIALPAN